jgi:hypothetical protein
MASTFFDFSHKASKLEAKCEHLMGTAALSVFQTEGNMGASNHDQYPAAFRLSSHPPFPFHPTHHPEGERTDSSCACHFKLAK